MSVEQEPALSDSSTSSGSVGSIEPAASHPREALDVLDEFAAIPLDAWNALDRSNPRSPSREPALSHMDELGSRPGRPPTRDIRTPHIFPENFQGG